MRCSEKKRRDSVQVVGRGWGSVHAHALLRLLKKGHIPFQSDGQFPQSDRILEMGQREGVREDGAVELFLPHPLHLHTAHRPPPCSFL